MEIPDSSTSLETGFCDVSVIWETRENYRRNGSDKGWLLGCIRIFTFPLNPPAPVHVSSNFGKALRKRGKWYCVRVSPCMYSCVKLDTLLRIIELTGSDPKKMKTSCDWHIP